MPLLYVVCDWLPIEGVGLAWGLLICFVQLPSIVVNKEEGRPSDYAHHQPYDGDDGVHHDDGLDLMMRPSSLASPHKHSPPLILLHNILPAIKMSKYNRIHHISMLHCSQYKRIWFM